VYHLQAQVHRANLGKKDLLEKQALEVKKVNQVKRDCQAALEKMVNLFLWN
jgi:hypothetical protein